MSKKIDLTGQRFGKLVVLREDGKKWDKVAWLCQCDCGKLHTTDGGSLRRGFVRSCGCTCGRRGLTKNCHHKSELYNNWLSMLRRSGIYKRRRVDARYADRNITLEQPEWLDFEVFEAWALSHGYKKGLELDRRDNDKGYSEANCQWVTRKQNARNRECSDKLPSGEHVFDFCERWLGREVTKREYKSISYHWHNNNKLPDFVFIAMRNRAIADLDAAHKRAENE